MTILRTLRRTPPGIPDAPALPDLPFLRRRRRRDIPGACRQQAPPPCSSPEPCLAGAPRSQDADGNREEKLLGDRLRALYRTLPALDQRLLTLRYAQEQTLTETARELGISSAWVEIRELRILRRLRNLL